MYRDTDRDGVVGILASVGLVLLVVGLMFAIATPHHPRHVKEKIEKLKGGRYAFKDKKNQWWIYTLKRVGEALADVDIPAADFPQPWLSSSGSMRLPMGGTWVKGEQPNPEEIEGELEASVEIGNEGPEADTDGGIDADASADVGGGDAGDTGDSGGGDGGGDAGGGDGGGGDGGGE